MSHFTAIVLSAGAGRRMNSEIPKQYLPLNGKPVIYYSLSTFENSLTDDIILVCGPEDVAYCRKEIVEKFHFNKIKAVVPGGQERYDSVFAGLQAAQGADYVLIHDGARPLVTGDMICRSMETVQKEKACVVGMPVKDTIKVVDEGGYAINTPDRNTLWMVQTPQTFSYPLVYGAYCKLFEAMGKQEELPFVTDDAMVVEHMTGQKVKLIPGSYANLKITTPEDLPVADLFYHRKDLVAEKH